MKNIPILLILVVLFFSLLVLANAARAAEAQKIFPEFSSLTLDAQPVTGDFFKGKKLTMLNIWATWCPPCVGEMPALGEMGRSMPEGSQLAGLVIDVKGPEDMKTVSRAKEIISRAQADFVQILPTEQMNSVLKNVRAIPTTIFVDSQGRIVGDPVVGARSEADYRAEAEKRLRSE